MISFRITRWGLASSAWIALAACGLTLDATAGADSPDATAPTPSEPDARSPGPPDATADAAPLDASDDTVADAGPPCSLTGTLRDFRAAHEDGGHPDFEAYLFGLQPGMVLNTLDDEGKPRRDGAYPVNDAGQGTSLSSDQSFAQWFRDVPGVNCTSPYTLPLEPVDAGALAYRNAAFFPLDGQCFGNYPNVPEHNYHFTYELRGRFLYRSGAYLSFTGDDDVWVFFDRTLQLDLGGVHGPESGTVSLDALGFSPGSAHDFVFFFAERHTVLSTFDFETNLEFEGCGAVFGPN